MAFANLGTRLAQVIAATPVKDPAPLLHRHVRFSASIYPIFALYFHNNHNTLALISGQLNLHCQLDYSHSLEAGYGLPHVSQLGRFPSLRS